MLYPAENAVDNTIRLPQESKELIETIKQLSSQIKDLENLKKEKENQLKNLLGENEEGLVDNWKITWKKISSRRFDSKAFKKEHPKMYEQFTKEKTYRRFSIKRSD
jgi:predicted phage-related endonuclease